MQSIGEFQIGKEAKVLVSTVLFVYIFVEIPPPPIVRTTTHIQYALYVFRTFLAGCGSRGQYNSALPQSIRPYMGEESRTLTGSQDPEGTHLKSVACATTVRRFYVEVQKIRV